MSRGGLTASNLGLDGEAKASFQQGTHLSNEASRLESRQVPDLRGAMGLYTRAAQIFREVAANERDPTYKQQIEGKANELESLANDIAEGLRAGGKSYTTQAFSVKKKGVLVDARSRFDKNWNVLVPGHTGREFTTLLYTPVACQKPSDFGGTRLGGFADGYTIRAKKELDHTIDYFITVTMYNEDAAELRSTLEHIAACLQFMMKTKGDRNLWKRFMVCVVSDGRTKANEGTLQYLHDIGNFDEQTMTINSQGIGVTCHLFESIPQLEKKTNELSNTVVYHPPLQLMFALKEHNAGKLDSHAWFFNAFTKQLNPTFVCLVDVGTMPSEQAIFRLMRSMENDKQVYATCG
jgi:chitin synthase